jgi:hypothetical protein
MQQRLETRGRWARLRPASLAVVIGVAAVLALAATGCGESTIDQDDEVNLVQKQLASDGLKAKSVECPDDVEAKEGETFKCDVTLTNGNTGTYTITVESVNDDNASLKVTDAQSTGKGD